MSLIVQKIQFCLYFAENVFFCTCLFTNSRVNSCLLYKDTIVISVKYGG